MNILEELADFELVCCSGDGTTLKVKDVGLLIITDDDYDESNGSFYAHSHHPRYKVPYLTIGKDHSPAGNDRNYFVKNTTEFEEVFGNFIIGRILQ